MNHKTSARARRLSRLALVALTATATVAVAACTRPHRPVGPRPTKAPTTTIDCGEAVVGLRPCLPPGDRVPGLIEAKRFDAFVNRPNIAGSPAALIVVGTLTLASPGYRVALEPVDPRPGASDLVLRLVTTPPTGMVAGVLTDYPVRYESSVFTEVETVTILPLGFHLDVFEPS